jgi:tRNA pseudouridine55 synthase
MERDGLLIIDKPIGMTSAEIVRIVKRCLQRKTGHLGTLDPFASGVLPICIGEATKIAQFLNAADKEYTGSIRLGRATDTGDPTGAVIAEAAVPPLEPAWLAQVAVQFCGERLQTPPMYSAVKQQGTPLYKLARQGIEVDRQPRLIRVRALTLNAAADGTVAFSVACSKGTYVRVLAQDIAAALGSVGHLEALRRTRFGQFRIADAIALDALHSATAALVSLRDALGDLREIRVDLPTATRVRHGYAPVLGALTAGTGEEAAKVIGPDGELAAVVVADHMGRWRFGRVFATGGHPAS